jgi:hypothetical protein
MVTWTRGAFDTKIHSKIRRDRFAAGLSVSNHLISDNTYLLSGRNEVCWAWLEAVVVAVARKIRLSKLKIGLYIRKNLQSNVPSSRGPKVFRRVTRRDTKRMRNLCFAIRQLFLIDITHRPSYFRAALQSIR